MLADPKSEALVENFTGPVVERPLTWTPSSPTSASYPGLRRQPARRRSGAKPSCSSTASSHEDRSVLDLLTADYTFVNERLAKHYGIPNVYGPQFRRVTAAGRTSTCGVDCSARARC